MSEKSAIKVCSDSGDTKMHNPIHDKRMIEGKSERAIQCKRALLTVLVECMAKNIRHYTVI